MKPRRTPSSNFVFRLPGGTEDNDLHCQKGVGYPRLVENDPCKNSPYVAVVYEPDQEERAALATGSNVELVLLTDVVPPMLMVTTREQPTSRPQRGGDDARIWAEIPKDLAEDLVAALDPIAIGVFQPEDIDDKSRGRIAALLVQLRTGLVALSERADEEAA